MRFSRRGFRLTQSDNRREAGSSMYLFSFFISFSSLFLFLLLFVFLLLFLFLFLLFIPFSFSFSFSFLYFSSFSLSSSCFFFFQIIHFLFFQLACCWDVGFWDVGGVWVWGGEVVGDPAKKIKNRNKKCIYKKYNMHITTS